MATNGLKGDAGTNGENGLKGDAGSNGENGLKGDAGSKARTASRAMRPERRERPQGRRRPNGENGLKGDAGRERRSTATQGLKGDAGTNGTNGLKGDKGDRRRQRHQRPQGRQGRHGRAGTNGATVARHRRTPTAPNGTNGTNGALVTVSNSGVLQAGQPHIVTGVLDLSNFQNTGTVTLTSAAVFANATAYVCTATDVTTGLGNPVVVSGKTTTSFVLTNTGGSRDRTATTWRTPVRGSNDEHCLEQARRRRPPRGPSREGEGSGLSPSAFSDGNRRDSDGCLFGIARSR